MRLQLPRLPRLSSKQSRVVVILGLFLVVLAGSGVLIAVPMARSGQITVGSLSERAREFLLSEQQKGNANWKGKNITDAEVSRPTSNTTVKTECFAITFPYVIRTVEKVLEAECIATVRVASPPARLTISIATLSGVLSEQPAVLMRETSSDTYSVSDFTHPQFPTSQTFTDPQGVSFFSVVNGDLLSVVFSETSNPTKILAETLPTTLTSLTTSATAEPTLASASTTIVQ